MTSTIMPSSRGGSRSATRRVVEGDAVVGGEAVQRVELVGGTGVDGGTNAQRRGRDGSRGAACDQPGGAHLAFKQYLYVHRSRDPVATEDPHDGATLE